MKRRNKKNISDSGFSTLKYFFISLICFIMGTKTSLSFFHSKTGEFQKVLYYKDFFSLIVKRKNVVSLQYLGTTDILCFFNGIVMRRSRPSLFCCAIYLRSKTVTDFI